MFFTGLISLGYEVIWTRSLLLYMGSTNYTFTTMLTTFLFGIAAGSFLLGVIAPRIRRPLLWLGLAEAGIGASIFLTLPGLWKASQIMESPAFEAISWGQYTLAKFGLCFGVMLVPTLLMGATFPLAAQVVVRSVSHIGRSVGSVYSINTLGSILGSALTGLVLMPLMGPGPAFVLLASANLALAAVVLFMAGPRSWKAWSVVSIGLIAVLLVTQEDLTRLARQTILTRIERQGEILFEEDGLEAHVAVQEDALGFRQLWVNGDVVARSTGSVSGHNLLGHLPMLFAEDNRETLIIALGTGISAGSTSLYDPDVLDVVEISSLVRDNVHYFALDNYALHENPKTNFIIDDGRNFVEIADRTYDVIGAEPLHPWKAGVANMYTKEYYEHCLDLLNPGGIVVQWIPLYGLNDQDARDLTKSFVKVFPETSYWLFGYDAVLLGHDGGFSIDLPDLRERLSHPGVWHDLNKVRIFSEIDLLNHLVMGPAELPSYVAQAQVMKDTHPFIEYEGPKHVHAGDPNSEILRGLVEHRGDPAAYIGDWGDHPDSLRSMIEVQNQVWGTVIEGVIAQKVERNMRRSEALLSAAVEQAPWLGDAKYYLSRTHYNIGMALGQRGGIPNIEEALRRYQEGLRLVPDSPSLLSRAANASERLSLRESAIGYWAQLMELLPDHARRRRLAEQRIEVLRRP